MSPVRALRHSLTLTWRSLTKIRHSPELLLDVIMLPIVFVVLFVFLFGTAIAGNWHTYLQYVLPGIAVQALLFGSLGTASVSDTTDHRRRKTPASRLPAPSRRAHPAVAGNPGARLPSHLAGRWLRPARCEGRRWYVVGGWPGRAASRGRGELCAVFDGVRLPSHPAGCGYVHADVKGDGGMWSAVGLGVPPRGAGANCAPSSMAFVFPHIRLGVVTSTQM
jgi:hypothetical protein